MDAGKNTVARKKWAEAVTKKERLPVGITASIKVEIGSNLGRYVVQGSVGTGGMGQVFKAVDPRLGRKVALKLLHPAHADNVEARARMLREAQALAQLSHRNVVTVFDVGTLDEDAYIAMEFLSGGTLVDWLKTPRTWRDIIDKFAEAGAGLAAAHREGIIHRDFKPENVLIAGDGRAVVTDFGLAMFGETTDAKEVGEDTAVDVVLAKKVTQSGMLTGTLPYIAPELFDGAPPDHRSDQYSLGVALYEALFKRHPFGIDTAAETPGFSDHLADDSEALPPPAATEVPAEICDVVMRTLRFDPDERYRDIDVVLAELRTAAVARAHKRRRLAAGLGAGLIVAATAIWLAIPNPSAPTPPPVTLPAPAVAAPLAAAAPVTPPSAAPTPPAEQPVAVTAPPAAATPAAATPTTSPEPTVPAPRPRKGKSKGKKPRPPEPGPTGDVGNGTVSPFSRGKKP